jgi:hypothetical protein
MKTALVLLSILLVLSYNKVSGQEKDGSSPSSSILNGSLLKDLFNQRFEASKDKEKDTSKDDGFFKSLMNHPLFKDLPNNSTLLERISKSLESKAKDEVDKEVGRDLERDVRRHSRNSTRDFGVFDRIRGFLDESRNGKPNNDEGVLRRLFSRSRGKDSESSSSSSRSMGESLMGLLGRSKREADLDKKPSNKNPKDSGDDEISTGRRRQSKERRTGRHYDDHDSDDEDHYESLRERLRNRRKNRRESRCPSSSSFSDSDDSGKTPEREKEIRDNDKPTKKNKRHYDEYDYFEDEFEDDHHGGHH